MASIRPWKGRYQVRWREKVEGQWKTRSRSCRTKAAAQALSREVEDTVVLDGHWQPRDQPRSAGPGKEPDLGELTGAFLRAQKSGGKADATILRYGQSLDVFLCWLGSTQNGRRLSGDLLSESLVTGFYIYLGKGTGRHGKPRSDSTRRKYVEVVLNCWGWLASKDEWRHYVPGQVPNLRHMDIAPAPRRRTLAPTWEEMDACIAVATGWQQRLYIVLRFTGLRVQQAMELRWSDIDFEQRTLRIRPELGKTQQEKQGRWVPISQHLLEILAGWGRREGYLVRTERRRGAGGRSERLARSRDAARAWRRASKAHGVRDGVATQPHHSFRKGFTSGLKKLGADDEAVEVLVGHSLGLRGLYTDPDAQPLAEAVALVPPLSTPTPSAKPIPIQRTA